MERFPGLSSESKLLLCVASPTEEAGRLSDVRTLTELPYVTQGGEVVESGSHDELVAADGIYAQSWNAQMRATSSVLHA